MRRLLSLFVPLGILLFAASRLSGQPMNSEFGDGMAERIEYTPDLQSDAALFYLPVESSYDVFSQISRFGFSAVRYWRRGYDPGLAGGYYVNGIDLGDPLSGWLNYPLLMALRRTGRRDSHTPGLQSGDRLMGGLCRISEYSMQPSLVRDGFSAEIYGSDRRHRLGGRISVAAPFGKEWKYAVSASFRDGRDGHIRGVFTEELNVGVALEKRFYKETHTLSLFVMAAVSRQGYPSAATQECFDLRNDPLYNPSWGFWDGKEMSARERRNRQPFALLVYKNPLAERTSLEISLAALGGRNSYSRLGWYQAQNPFPDYYRHLPSFVQGNAPDAYEPLLAAWRTGDPAWTQLNWAEIVYVNKVGAHYGDPATYVLADQVEQLRNLQLFASLSHSLNRRLDVTGGIRLRRDRSRCFREVRNLLGADYLLDIDPYLIDDEVYGNCLWNDMRNPGRQVKEGGRFGYDYAMRYDSYGASAQLRYSDNRFRFSAGIEGVGVSFLREGFYEKELYPGEASFGKSPKINLLSYDAKMSAGYAFSPRRRLDLSVKIAETPPACSRVFLSPEYRNQTIDKQECMQIMASELNYYLSLNPLRLKIAGFWTCTRRESDIFQYYDDLARAYCNMVLTGINKCYYGVELGAEVRFTPRLLMNLAASTASYTYESNPAVDLYLDMDGTPLVIAGKSSMRGYRIGSTPQRVAAVELKYSAAKGWYITASWNWMGERYVQSNPLRRMPRVLALAGSEEAFAQLAGQERLAEAAVVNLFVYKFLRFKKGGRNNFFAMASVNNLLGRTDIRYSGYEPMRLERIGTNANQTYRPFANKYLYAYGRTFYASVGCRF